MHLSISICILLQGIIQQYTDKKEVYFMQAKVNGRIHGQENNTS